MIWMLKLCLSSISCILDDESSAYYVLSINVSPFVSYIDIFPAQRRDPLKRFALLLMYDFSFNENRQYDAYSRW